MVVVISFLSPASAVEARTKLVSRYQGVDAIHGESSTFRGMKIDLSDFYALDRPGSPQLGPLRRME
jgi:hypothetical protein